MRKLSFDEIRAAALGVERVCEEAGGVRFYRFTEEEETLYRFRTADFYQKTFATAGVKISFRTDSRHLSLAVTAEKGGSSRTFFSVDVLADGTPVGCLDNFGTQPIPCPPALVEFPLGDFAGDFDLGEGEKTVSVYLPWSVVISLRSLSLDDEASFAPCKPEKRLLAYGDSITHGYDATRPHLRQITRICDTFGLEEYNKAIGGEIFFPALAECTCDLDPDYILVAYGTNDWYRTDEKTFSDNCAAFYAALAARHKNTPIFALTPIPRGDQEEKRPFGDFANVAERIREVAAAHKSITVIDGSVMLPNEERFFSDKFLHPNDEGFSHYYENLRRALTPYLK